MGMKDVRGRAKREDEYYRANPLRYCQVCGRRLCAGPIWSARSPALRNRASQLPRGLARPRWGVNRFLESRSTDQYHPNYLYRFSSEWVPSKQRGPGIRSHMKIDVRYYCRNPKCRSKLREPASNQREAFCARGCHTSFYRKRCLICERPMERKTEQQLICGKRLCRNALAARPYLGRYHIPRHRRLALSKTQ